MTAFPQQHQKTNSLAVASMVLGIVGWLLFILYILVDFVATGLGIITAGVGFILYCCILPAACFPPIAWLVGIITGHVSLSQIRGTYQSGRGMGVAGLVMSYIGFGLIILSICALIILPILGISISIPFLSELSRATY